MNGPDDLEGERRQEAGRWLAVALDDMRIARIALDVAPPMRSVAACHCQQAAEKLMKGSLVLAGTPFAKTHDLEKVGALAGMAYPQWAALFAITGPWTVWATAYRYPELEATPEPSVDALNQALQTAAEIEAHLRTLGVCEPSR